MSFIYPNNASTIGKTPLVRIQRLSKGKNILAKIEYRNPAGSVKCRIGASMVWNAERTGRLKEGMELVEPTSGNTGIALAFVAAAKGIPLTLTMPSSMSIERRQLLKTFGAKLILTEPEKGVRGAIEKAQELVDSDPDRYLMLQQFDNPANPAIHEKTTGPEIWRDTDGRVDVLIAGVGTGGTLTGIARYLKHTQGKNVITVAVEPEGSSVITQFLAGEELVPGPHKIQGIGAGFIPKNLDLSVVDRVETVSNEESIDVARQLAAQEGILCGISCGAAMAVAMRLSQLPEFEGKTFVVIMPDSGERYLSTSLFEDVFTEQDLIP